MTMAMLVLQGVLITYKGGHELARERFTDDGKTLTCHVTAMGQTLTEEVSRQPRRARFEAGGKKGEVDVPDGTVVLENLFWQQYALAAEGRPADGKARPIKVLLPTQATTVDGTILVRATAGGGKQIEVVISGLKVEAEIGKDGAVTQARVAAQEIEVRPEGAAPPAVAAPAARAAPAGIVEEAVEIQGDGTVPVRGTLWLPAAKAGKKPPLLLLIAGSGPTDRDGNSKLGLRTDAYRLLAEALVRRGAAVLRYDKRGLGVVPPSFDPGKLSVEDYVNDAAAFVDKMRGSGRFSSLLVAGHSEGGLIAILLAGRVNAPRPSPSPSAQGRAKLDGLVLLATAGRPFAALVHEQLSRQIDAPTLAEYEHQVGELRAGRPVDTSKLPAGVAELLHPLVQRYIKSEMDIDPAARLRALKLPTTIVQGTTDIQVAVVDARLLSKARPDATLVLIESANHLFKEEKTRAPNQPSYNDPSRPLVPAVVDAVARALALR